MVESVETKPERWQTKISNLKDGIRHIYKTKDFWDTIVVVKGKEFKCHRFILAARSPVFEQLLQFNTSERLHIDNFDAPIDGFEVLLRFMYTDELGTNDCSIILNAQRAARHFKQQGLLKECEKVISTWEITVDNVFDMLNQSLDIPDLSNRCCQFIEQNAAAVLQSEAFLKAELESLWIALKSGKLNQIPVYELIQKVIHWGAEKHAEFSDYSVVRELLLSTDKPVMGLLGFEKLKQDELAKVAANYRGLLLPEEITAFLLNTVSPGLNLPDWCQHDKDEDN